MRCCVSDALLVGVGVGVFNRGVVTVGVEEEAVLEVDVSGGRLSLSQAGCVPVGNAGVWVEPVLAELSEVPEPVDP